MIAIALCALIVPFADLSAKAWLRAAVGTKSLSLGPLGHLQARSARIWAQRARPLTSSKAVWFAWMILTAAAAWACWFIPTLSWPFGLLVGGALSHAIETSLRGGICDPICLRFWPAFDLADVALTAGAIGAAVVLLGLR